MAFSASERYRASLSTSEAVTSRELAVLAVQPARRPVERGEEQEPEDGRDRGRDEERVATGRRDVGVDGGGIGVDLVRGDDLARSRRIGPGRRPRGSVGRVPDSKTCSAPSPSESSLSTSPSSASSRSCSISKRWPRNSGRSEKTTVPSGRQILRRRTLPESTRRASVVVDGHARQAGRIVERAGGQERVDERVDDRLGASRGFVRGRLLDVLCASTRR